MKKFIEDNRGYISYILAWIIGVSIAYACFDFINRTFFFPYGPYIVRSRDMITLRYGSGNGSLLEQVLWTMQTHWLFLAFMVLLTLAMVRTAQTFIYRLKRK